MKKLLVGITPESSLLAELSITLLRVFTGLTLAFAHGHMKIPPSDQFINGVGALGFPMPSIFAWAAAIAEFGGGLLMAIGLITRPAATLVAFTMAVAAFGQHAQDAFNIKELALLFLCISLVFVFRGASRLSVDRLIA